MGRVRLRRNDPPRSYENPSTPSIPLKFVRGIIESVHWTVRTPRRAKAPRR